MAQVPQKIKYQAIVRDVNNQIIANKTIGVFVAIKRQPSGGIPLVYYTESHTVTTNANGLINLVIGGGKLLTGKMSYIEWNNGPIYIALAFDFEGGTNYTYNTENYELLSVPYALYSANGTPGPTGATGVDGREGATGPTGPIAGNDKQIIYNDNNEAAGSNNFVFDKTLNNVGIGTESPNSSAILDLNTTNKGFLPPRMTTEQMNAIANPVEGLTIYNTSLQGLCYYSNKWNCMDYYSLSNMFFTCGNDLFDTRDNQSYATVKIGTQCWMQENLNVGQLMYGSDYFQGQYYDEWACSDNGIIEKYCYGFSIIDYDYSNCDIYGGLYTWYEMMQYVETEKAQGICPKGWHIPSRGEWSLLIEYLGGTTVAGGKMKMTGTSFWNSPNTNATNSSGFSALGAGNGFAFDNMKEYGLFWTSTAKENPQTLDDLYDAWACELLSSSEGVIFNNYFSKLNAYSVRCIKD